MVAVTGVEPAFNAVNEGWLPVPLAARPMDGVLFVQLKLAPAGVLVKVLAATVAELHSVIFPGTVTVGMGFTFTVTVAEPVQPFEFPVTV